MILFPKIVVVALVVGALTLTGVSLIALIVMALKDRKSKKLW